MLYYYTLGNIFKTNIIEQIIIKKKKLRGSRFFQPNFIKWSYLYLGKAALTNKNINTLKLTFIAKIREVFKKMPLPQSRVEFESRATLFQFLNDIEEFLEMKKDYMEKWRDSKR